MRSSSLAIEEKQERDTHHTPRSSLRHRPTHSQTTTAPTLLTPRASLTTREQKGRSLTDGRSAPDEHPGTRGRPLHIVTDHSQETPVLHWSKRIPFGWWIIAGMLGMAVIGLLIVQIDAWGTNTFFSPSSRATITIISQENIRYQVHAFVDEQNKIEMLTTREDDPGQHRLVVGSKLVGLDDPQHATILLSTTGETLAFTIEGPLLTHWYESYRQNTNAQWSYSELLPPKPSA